MHTPRLGVTLGWNRPAFNAYASTWSYLGLESAANHDFATCMVLHNILYKRSKKEHADFNKYFFDFLQATYISQYMSNLTDKLKWKPTHKLNREKIGRPI
jgi:hypothetical protein